MTQERIKLLEDLGFAWSTTSFNIKQDPNLDEHFPESDKHSDDESDRSVQSSNAKDEADS